MPVLRHRLAAIPGWLRRRRPRLTPARAHLLGGLALLVAVLETWAPVVHRPEPEPFSGSRWYNPYSRYRGFGLRCNFHAHNRCWGGIPSGEQSLEVLQAAYAARRYDVAAVSNYMSITPPSDDDSIHVAAYEHALNLGQQHQTVLGAESVMWMDYPLWQSFDQKQHLIDLLSGSGELIVINHPLKGQGYEPADFRDLRGFHGLEVYTKHTRGAFELWDAALSAGQPVWGFCSDDGHDVIDGGKSHCGMGWVVVHAEERSTEGVLDALRRGWFHGVFDREQVGVNALHSCRVDDGVLRVALRDPADELCFIGQGGRLLAKVEGERFAEYALREDDHYVRVQAVTDGTQLLLNPVYRYEDDPLESWARAETLPVRTGLRRTLGGLLGLGAWWLLGRAARRRRGLDQGTDGRGRPSTSTYPPARSTTRKEALSEAFSR